MVDMCIRITFVSLFIAGLALIFSGCDKSHRDVVIEEPGAGTLTFVPDSDGDGIPDRDDNCPSSPNPLQEDSDGDGVGDVCDSCVDVFNPGQEDVDGDGIGDACVDRAPPTFFGVRGIGASLENAEPVLQVSWRTPVLDDTTLEDAVVVEIYLAGSSGDQDFLNPTLVVPAAPGSVVIGAADLGGFAPGDPVFVVARARDELDNIDQNTVELSVTLPADLLHIDAASQGQGDGSAANPFGNFGEAFDLAVNLTNGATILVTGGVYTTFTAGLQGSAAYIQVFGGFDSTFAISTRNPDGNPSIIEPSAGTGLIVGLPTRWDGFTFRTTGDCLLTQAFQLPLLLQVSHCTFRDVPSQANAAFLMRYQGSSLVGMNLAVAGNDFVDVEVLEAYLDIDSGNGQLCFDNNRSDTIRNGSDVVRGVFTLPGSPGEFHLSHNSLKGDSDGGKAFRFLMQEDEEVQLGGDVESLDVLMEQNLLLALEGAISFDDYTLPAGPVRIRVRDNTAQGFTSLPGTPDSDVFQFALQSFEAVVASGATDLEFSGNHVSNANGTGRELLRVDLTVAPQSEAVVSVTENTFQSGTSSLVRLGSGAPSMFPGDHDLGRFDVDVANNLFASAEGAGLEVRVAVSPGGLTEVDVRSNRFTGTGPGGEGAVELEILDLFGSPGGDPGSIAPSVFVGTVGNNVFGAGVQRAVDVDQFFDSGITSFVALYNNVLTGTIEGGGFDVNLQPRASIYAARNVLMGGGSDSDDDQHGYDLSLRAPSECYVENDIVALMPSSGIFYDAFPFVAGGQFFLDGGVPQVSNVTVHQNGGAQPDIAGIQDGGQAVQSSRVVSFPGLPVNSSLPPAVDTISVPATGGIADLNVGVGITHSFVGDLAIDLQHPDSTVVSLKTVDGGGGGSVDVTFDDEGVPYDLFQIGFGLLMQPQGPGALSDFDDRDRAGDWTLTVEDGGGNGDGFFNSWFLDFGPWASPISVRNSIATLNGVEDLAATITPSYGLTEDRDPPAGLGSLNGDPLFNTGTDISNWPIYFRVTPDSPALNAGDPAPAANNSDGSRNTLGAFGGPLGAALGVQEDGAPFYAVGTFPLTGLDSGGELLSPNSALWVFFSDDLDQASVTADSFRVSQESGGALAGTLSVFDRLVVFAPGNGFPPGELLTLEVTPDVRRVDGRPLAATFRRSVGILPATMVLAEPQGGNEDVATATPLPTGRVFAIESDLEDAAIGDRDLYSLDLARGQRLQATVYSAFRLDLDLLDAQLYLLDATGRVIAASDNVFALDPFIDVTIEEDGNYVLQVVECCDNVGFYRLVGTVRN